jgi:hypothetical protein
VYAHAHERYGDKLVKYIRKVEEFNSETGQKEAIFPEEFDAENLAIIKKSKKVFAAQYENDPDDGASGFSREWKRYFYWTSINTIAVFDGDQRTTINVRDLDICVLIDPGKITGGFCVTGMDYLGRVFVLVALPIDLKPPDLTDLVFKNVIRWQPRTVAFEADFFAEVYQYWWASEMSKRGVRFHVTPVYTKKSAKDDRIMGLSHYMSNGKFYFNESQTELNHEWNQFGKTRDIHILDALAYGPEVWRPGFAPGQRDIVETPVGPQNHDGRDDETGYSKIS